MAIHPSEHRDWRWQVANARAAGSPTPTLTVHRRMGRVGVSQVVNSGTANIPLAFPCPFGCGKHPPVEGSVFARPHATCAVAPNGANGACLTCAAHRCRTAPPATTRAPPSRRTGRRGGSTASSATPVCAPGVCAPIAASGPGCAPCAKRSYARAAEHRSIPAWTAHFTVIEIAMGVDHTVSARAITTILLPMLTACCKPQIKTSPWKACRDSHEVTIYHPKVLLPITLSSFSSAFANFSTLPSFAN